VLARDGEEVPAEGEVVAAERPVTRDDAERERLVVGVPDRDAEADAVPLDADLEEPKHPHGDQGNRHQQQASDA
jgi:hypothetical protein